MTVRPGRLVLLGHPVAHSLSPRFQNAALRRAGIPLTYEVLDVAPAALDDALAGLREVNGAGNVTIPHKEAVAARCEILRPLAERCAAVNTFWFEHGALVGDNTDVGGAEMVLRAFLQRDVQRARVALIGAGGSAAAVLCAAERCGIVDVRMYNRDMSRAERLAEKFPGVRVAASMADAVRDADLVVNATPVGMRDDEHPVPLALLPEGAGVFDLVYKPTETSWVRAAREAGHRASDGEGMLLEQGALAFEKWFGVVPDRAAMWKALH